MIVPLDTFFLVLVLVSGVVAMTLRDLLAAVIVFSAFSFFSAMFYASLGALDVAFTEAAVGTAVSTVLLVTVVFRTRRRTEKVARPPATVAGLGVALAVLLAAVGLGRAAVRLPAVGDPDSPAARHVSPRYIEEGPAETGAANMVTAVLADYRGYDTLGETVVIFTAGLACLLVLGTAAPRRDDEQGP